MDIKERFNIINFQKDYCNLKTWISIDSNISEEKKLEFMVKIIKTIINKSSIISNYIKILDEETIAKIYSEENFKQIKVEKNKINKNLIPLTMDWDFYRGNTGNLYLDIFFVLNNYEKKCFKNFWFKCLYSIEDIKKYLISPLINFGLIFFINFEDGGRVIVEIDNNLEIINSLDAVKSIEAIHFLKEFSKKDVEELIL